MPRIHLTAKAVADSAKQWTATNTKTGKTELYKLPVKGEQPLILWDTIVEGLHLRIGYGGKRTYSVRPRVNGDQTIIKLGTTKNTALAEARENAREVIELASRGVDPRKLENRSAVVHKRDTERVVFAEASASQSTLKLVLQGELDDTLLDGLDNYVQRQRQRLRERE